MTVPVYVPRDPLIKNNPAGYTFRVILLDSADPKYALNNPPLQLADFTLIGNGAFIGTLSTLAVAVVGALRVVNVTLTQAETNYDSIEILAHDNAGALWCDLFIVPMVVELQNVGTSDLTAAMIAGSGVISWPYTLTDDVGGLPIADAYVWVTTDAAGLNIVASGRTNAFGIVTFNLDAGTYYFWRKKTGIDFRDIDGNIYDIEVVA